MLEGETEWQLSLPHKGPCKRLVSSSSQYAEMRKGVSRNQLQRIEDSHSGNMVSALTNKETGYTTGSLEIAGSWSLSPPRKNGYLPLGVNSCGHLADCQMKQGNWTQLNDMDNVSGPHWNPG